MNSGYYTDMERSAQRPAGPHLIEQSSDVPAQRMSRGQVTLSKSYTATVTTVVSAIRITQKS